MTTKKATKPRSTEKNRLKHIVALRGTDEWKAWLDKLAALNSAPVTVTIEQALKELAARLDAPKPPRRTP